MVSVGNLSVGGTGKTPLVAQIAQWLIAQGERPAVLSRGYGRRDRQDGVVVVSDGVAPRASVAAAGDEPLMLARTLPDAIVCVCEDRHMAGVLAERRLGATVHVLDDGFQHVRLARDLDVLVTSPGEVSRGRVLPFGRLREAPGAAARAHFVVVVDADEEVARAEAWELGISQFAAARRVIAAPPPATAPTGRADAAAAGMFAVAGIGKPEQFFAMLQAAGYPVQGTMRFPDHHRYTARDARRIVAAARNAGAASVATTDKDLVKLEALDLQPLTLMSVPLSLDIAGWDRLTALMAAAIERRRSESDEYPGSVC